MYKMAMSILLKFLTLKWNILRTIGRIEVGDGSCFFFAFFRLFHLSLSFFDRRFPLNNGNSKQLKESLPEIAVCLRSGLGLVVL